MQLITHRDVDGPSVRRSARRSYTLIELIIVIALLALAAALLVPNLVGQDSMTLQTAVRMLIADLSFAQSDALANQGIRRVVFYTDGSGYCIIQCPSVSYPTPLDLDDPSVDYVVDPLHARGRYVVSYTADKRWKGVSIESALIEGKNLSNRPELTYDPLGGIVDGTSVGQGGNLVMKFNNVRYQITVAGFTGKLTVAAL